MGAEREGMDRVTAGSTLPAGVRVGHWTDPVGRTGCTVVLTAAGAVGGVDVRGGAPGTLGTDALRPGTVVQTRARRSGE